SSRCWMNATVAMPRWSWALRGSVVSACRKASAATSFCPAATASQPARSRRAERGSDCAAAGAAVPNAAASASRTTAHCIEQFYPGLAGGGRGPPLVLDAPPQACVNTRPGVERFVDGGGYGVARRHRALFGLRISRKRPRPPLPGSAPLHVFFQPPVAVA